MAADWGNVPAWFAAAGTVATFATLKIALGDYRTREKERLDGQKRQARRIVMEFSYPGGVRLDVTNHSSEPIFEFELESARMSTAPSAPWRVNRSVIGAGTSIDIVAAHEGVWMALEFLQPDGKPYDFQHHLGETPTYSGTIKFTDAAGLRWRRVDSRLPTRVYT